MIVSEEDPVSFKNLVLESKGMIVVGMIDSEAEGDDQAPIVVVGKKALNTPAEHL